MKNWGPIDGQTQVRLTLVLSSREAMPALYPRLPLKAALAQTTS